MKRAFLLLLTFVTLTGLTCLPAVWQVPDPTSDQTSQASGTTSGQPREVGLRAFASAEQMQTYMAEQAIARLAAQGSGYTGFGAFSCALPVPAALDLTMGTGAAPADVAAEGDAGGGDRFSTTNVQEAGVDEADVVKNDAGYLYLIKDQSVRIVRAVPAGDLQQVANIALSETPDSMYLYGERLVVLSSSGGWWRGWEGGITPMVVQEGTWPDGAWASEQVTVRIIDVADPAAPAELAKLEFEGRLASSRMIASKLHLVLVIVPILPASPTPEAIRSRTLEQWIPDYRITGPDAATREGDMMQWQDFYYPLSPDGYGITSVITVDVNDPTAGFTSVGISADAGTIYASREALYVTDPSYAFGSWREETVVHKFDLTGDAAEYVGSGLVPGHLLNQYSLGESAGYLRLATTTESFAFTETGDRTNGVYVLGEGATAGQLEIVGRVEGIAPGESIYSARFVGDRGFLVTFKKIDPLFTLDLSDPRNPRLVGTLKVPGCSDYIHLLDEDHLLTIGKDAQDVGDFAWYQGVQLSIFDVTDFANPVLLHKEIIGTRGTESEALWNPKAFNFFAPRNALAIPIDLYEGQTNGPEYGVHTFTGLYVYRVTPADGFHLLGRISTRAVSPDAPYGSAWGWDAYTRGIFIGDDVYAVTDQVVKSAPIETPSQVTDSLDLP